MRNTMLAVLMAVTMAAMVLGQIPKNGLVAQYMFTGGSLVDSSGHGNNLTPYTPTPELTTDRDMMPNNAYLFKGTINGALQGQDEAFPIGSSDRSVSFWIALAEKDDTVQQVLTWGSLGTGCDTTNSFRIVFRRDTLCIQERGVRIAKNKVSIADFPALGNYDQPWVNVAVTIKADTVRWYINGIMDTTIALSTSLNTSVTSKTNLYVGAAGGGRKLKAKLDEILVYSRALTDQEIVGVYDPIVAVSYRSIARKSTPIGMNVHTVLLNGRELPKGINRQEWKKNILLTR